MRGAAMVDARAVHLPPYATTRNLTSVCSEHVHACCSQALLHQRVVLYISRSTASHVSLGIPILPCLVSVEAMHGRAARSGGSGGCHADICAAVGMIDLFCSTVAGDHHDHERCGCAADVPGTRMHVRTAVTLTSGKQRNRRHSFMHTNCGTSDGACGDDSLAHNHADATILEMPHF